MALERDTDSLIDGLAASAKPVRRLPPPARRALLWLALTGAVIAFFVVYHGVRPDLMAAMAEPGAGLSWISGLATGLAAAFAAFYLAVPGRSSRWALLPLPLAVLWVSGLGLGCYADWIRFGPSGLRLGDSFDCFSFILLMSVLIGVPMAAMLRHARLVRPVATAAMGGLAMASLASAGLELFHRSHAQFMDIVWHSLAITVVVIVCSGTGLVSSAQPTRRRRAGR